MRHDQDPHRERRPLLLVAPHVIVPWRRRLAAAAAAKRARQHQRGGKPTPPAAAAAAAAMRPLLLRWVRVVGAEEGGMDFCQDLGGVGCRDDRSAGAGL